MPSTGVGRRPVVAGLVAAAALGRPALAQTVELDFPTWQAEETGTGPFWSAATAAFETAHPGVQVKKYAVPLRDYVDKMTTRFAAGKPPDIVHLPTRSVAAYAAQDKKNQGGRINCTLLRGIGQGVYDQPITLADIMDALHYYQ